MSETSVCARSQPPARAINSASVVSDAHLKGLLRCGMTGDDRARDELLRLVRPLIRSFLRRRLQDETSDIDDLVQETLLALYTGQSTFDHSRPFSPWLFAIARRKLLDHFRRRRRYIHLDGIEPQLVERGFEEASNSRLDIQRLLQKLPRKQAETILATKILGKSVAEAAHDNDISVSDAKVSVHRGLNRLSHCVESGAC